MLFNSFEFLVFLPIAFGLYWFVCNRNLKLQNALVLLASYVFYGWWDYRFLGLILLSTVVDFLAGLAMVQVQKGHVRKLILALSLFFNLGLLGVFKYYNFFVTSWVNLFDSFGYHITSLTTINIILPVGISFYTFQTLSYTLDAYKGKINPTRDFIAFAAFVSFFPQLVAGPIERASNLLPQLLGKRNFSYKQGVDGLRLILWGLFKKVLIADTLAPDVDYIFAHFDTLNSGTLLLGAVYFSIQIYCDFSGYSDIAIGVSKLFGLELMSNFKFPYFSRNISEFWHRWHISLSTWFRDYVYIPLGGSRMGRGKAIRNIFIIFLVSGFWHGANWTFLVWGGIHAVLYLPLFLVKRNRTHLDADVAQERKSPSGKELLQMFRTFSLVTLAWVFFRSPDVLSAIEYLWRLGTQWKGEVGSTTGLLYLLPLFVLEWPMRKDERVILLSRKRWLRYTLYILMAFMIYDRLFSSDLQFIYFQF
jgi:D-alanyl-lipoteichoic acid acyltransferase DltB (MBOAT superfamily)